MVKLYVVNCGTENLQVFVTSDTREETEQNFWSLYNHRATEQADPEWAEETTIVFWTGKTRLLRAFRRAAINGIHNSHMDKFKGKRGALIPAIADKIAARRWHNCATKPYLRQVSIANLNCYALGTISAEKPDSDYSA